MPDEKCIVDPERDCIGKAAAAKLEARIDALEFLGVLLPSLQCE